MTGPTHIAIALTFGILAGAGKPQLAVMAAGAIHNTALLNAS